MKYPIVLAFTLMSVFGYGQDYHQWSEHFGARASLLGGAATSGLGDNATVYYNPAAMSFVENPSLSITVNAYRIRNLKLENALGKDLDLKSTQLSTSPNLIAGILRLGKKKKLSLGYGVITRRSYTAKYDFLHEANYEILESTAGPERFVASYNLFHQLTEYWGGFALSYPLSETFSVGFAHYGIYREVKYNNSNEMSVLPSDYTTGDITSISTNISFNYWNVKGIFKPSIAFHIENFKLGISLTTPSFNMLGRANVYRDFSFLNIDEGIGTDLTFIDRAEKVKVQHKENGALAFGVSWRLGKKAWLHVTNETFFGGTFYYIFNPDQQPNVYPVIIPDEDVLEFFGNQNFLAFGEETHAITNLGMGFETQLGPRWDLYLGARTDFLYNEQPYFLFNKIGIEGSKWNLYHFSLGMVYKTKKGKKYTIGLEYGFTPRKEFYHIQDFTTPLVKNSLLGNGSRGAYANQFSFKLLIEISLGKSLEEEKEL